MNRKCILLHRIWLSYTYSLAEQKTNIMNFQIFCKNSRDWNPVLLSIYEWTPNSKIWNPLRWICWKLEQLRTPKEYDDRCDDWDFTIEFSETEKFYEEEQIEWLTDEMIVESINAKYHYLRDQEII